MLFRIMLKYIPLFFHQAHLIEVANIREWKLVVSVNHEKGKKYSLLIHTVEPQAALRVDAVYHGVPGAPELPCFGVKFQTFAPVARAQWTGLSGETYPDRYKGGVFGCHEEVPHIAPALVPQDCGLHMDTQQVVLQLADGSELTLEQTGEPFAFSALPNTAQEIEAAQHISELPNTGRTSITVLGAVRGVGGIDSWGTDVEKPYHIPGDRDHSVSFRIVF